MSIGEPFKPFGTHAEAPRGKALDMGLEVIVHRSERSNRSELLPLLADTDSFDSSLIPIAHPSQLAPELEAAAARGAEALARLWCALSRCQQIDLKAHFDACWALAERTDARLRGDE